MAKMFYSAKEAAQRLNKSEDDLKALVRAGALREFRDSGGVNYKVEDVDSYAEKNPPAPKGGGGSAASSSGEIVLEPIEDSAIELAPSASDVVTLEAADKEDTVVGSRKGKKAKEGTAVPSVGINVFDDEELDEIVDPLAQTAVSDVAGLGIEGIGSGSGILDLTKESDDTSLGAELLEEIYTEEEPERKPSAKMGEDTRAGLDESIPEPEDELAAVGAPASGPRRSVTRVVDYSPDSVSAALTALSVVALIVLCFAGMGAAGLTRGITPGILQSIFDNLGYYSGGALLAAIAAGGITYLLNKRKE